MSSGSTSPGKADGLDDFESALRRVAQDDGDRRAAGAALSFQAQQSQLHAEVAFGTDLTAEATNAPQPTVLDLERGKSVTFGDQRQDGRVEGTGLPDTYPVPRYGSGVARANGIQTMPTAAQNGGVGVESLALDNVAPAACAETTVLVAVESALLREALVAALGALDGFRVVGEAATDDQALEAAAEARPESAGSTRAVRQPWPGQFTITAGSQQWRAASAAIGRARHQQFRRSLPAACEYVQIGAPARDLLRAVRTAISNY